MARDVPEPDSSPTAATAAITTPGDPRRPLVMVCGVDPTAYTGGHVSYVQAHALAAAAAGLAPQIFCVSPRSELEITDYGVLHRVATPVHHYLLAPTYTRPLARAIASYLEASEYPSPHVIHAFGPWAATAVSAARKLARHEVATVVIASAYTTVAHEWKPTVQGLGAHDRVRTTLRYRGWYPWVRTVVSRVERRGYERSAVVLVNYDSVARLLRAACGTDLEIRRLPYASPAAFSSGVAGPAEGSPPATPDPIRHLRPVDAPLIVSLSRHAPRKGLHILLRALAALSSAGVDYRAALVGPGRLLTDHRRLAASLGLAERLAIPGEVDDVLPYLRAATSSCCHRWRRGAAPCRYSKPSRLARRSSPHAATGYPRI